jgi:hypothetical protein
MLNELQKDRIDGDEERVNDSTWCRLANLRREKATAPERTGIIDHAFVV